jgi:nitrite reductase/ring-hydroxylating ferredoxin subunit
MDKTYNWIRIAEDTGSFEFNKNQIAQIEVSEKKICIVQTKSGLKACSSKCPHAGGDLSLGFLDKRENIICPVHGYHFNLRTGRDTNEEGYFLKIYPLKITENGVFIGI